ncbi:MAG TPA: response regulator [Polyangia bacterium]|jgi:FixJ family two-component response regulator
MNAGSVFVVDDDPDCLVGLGELLEDEGFRPSLFRCAADVLGALAASAEMPSVIVLDLHLPDVSHGDLIAMFEAHADWSRVPQIVFTAWNDASARAGLGRPVVRKPDVESLIGAIARLCRRPPRSAPRDARRAPPTDR